MCGIASYDDVHHPLHYTNPVPFDLLPGDHADNTTFPRAITVLAPNDTAIMSLLDSLSLSVHSYLTMDQTWLRTILYTHAIPSVGLPWKVGDVYPTFNPFENITVVPGRVPGEVGIRTALTQGYINVTQPANVTICQTQWYALDGVALPPIAARLELTGGFPAGYEQFLDSFGQQHSLGL